jgi:hypothetical protein
MPPGPDVAIQAPVLPVNLAHAGHEGGGFFVPHLDEADFILVSAERFDDAVDALAGNSENGVDSPIEHRFHKNVACVFCHWPDLNDNVRTIGALKSVCKWTQESGFVFSSAACA